MVSAPGFQLAKHTSPCFSTPIGFRAILLPMRVVMAASQPSGHRYPATNVSILPAQQRHLRLEGLEAEARYRFRIQAITAHGLGQEFEEEVHLARMLSGGQPSQNRADSGQYGHGGEVEISSSTHDSSAAAAPGGGWLAATHCGAVALFLLLRCVMARDMQ